MDRKDNKKNKDKYLVMGILVLTLLSLGFVSSEIDTSDPEYLKVLSEFDEGKNGFLL